MTMLHNLHQSLEQLEKRGLRKKKNLSAAAQKAKGEDAH
jgi:hypothetical protein